VDLPVGDDCQQPIILIRQTRPQQLGWFSLNATNFAVSIPANKGSNGRCDVSKRFIT
jgi:hypothetical protein